MIVYNWVITLIIIIYLFCILICSNSNPKKKITNIVSMSFQKRKRSRDGLWNGAISFSKTNESLILFQKCSNDQNSKHAGNDTVVETGRWDWNTTKAQEMA